MSIENKVPMSDFTEVTDIADTARIIGLQDNENVKIPLQSLTAKILSRVDEDILTVNNINVEGGVTGFNPIGEVKEGDMRAVSGEEVWNKIPLIEDNDVDIYDYILDDTVINSNGLPQTNASRIGYKSIVNLPLKKGDTIYIRSEYMSSYYSLIIDLAVYPYLITTPITTVNIIEDCLFNMSIKRPTDTNIVAFVSFSQEVYVGAINGKEIEAKSLAFDNTTPNPIGNNNAVNLGYLKENTLNKQNLEIIPSNNLALNFIKDKAVLNNGTIGNNVGWVMLSVDVSKYPVGTKFVFGNFSIVTDGYSAFYSGLNLSKYNGQYNDTTLPKVVEKTTECDILYIDVARPGQAATTWDETICNVGDVLIDYESPKGTIKSIDGYELVSQPIIEDKYYFPKQNRSYLANGLKPIVNFQFDDLNVTDLAVLDIFKEFKIPCNFAILGSRVNANSIKLYQEVEKMGGSILSHTMTHPVMNATNIPLETAESEIVGGKSVIVNQGIICNGFVTPSSVLNAIYKPILNRSHSYAFTKSTSTFNKTTNVMELSRFSMEGTDVVGNGNSLQMITDKIDECVTDNLMVSFYAHKMPSGRLDVNGVDGFTEDKLRLILTHLKKYIDRGEIIATSTDKAIELYYL